MSNIPKSKEQVKEENAEIYWGDETGLCSDCPYGRGDAPRGKTPVIALSAKRSSSATGQTRPLLLGECEV